jgi:hypothetical protein
MITKHERIIHRSNGQVLDSGSDITYIFICKMF